MSIVYSVNVAVEEFSFVDMGKEKPWLMLLAEYKVLMALCLEFYQRYIMHDIIYEWQMSQNVFNSLGVFSNF